MAAAGEHVGDPHATRHRMSLGAAVAVILPALAVRVSGAHPSHPLAVVLFGLAIVGAAFLLSWAAEVAQLDISAGLALAVLAFIAVLPEYAVDAVFAWKGGDAFSRHGGACHAPGAQGASPCSLALANMTGSNRLLIGIGWSMVIAVTWWRCRKRGQRTRGVRLGRSHSVELAYLLAATAYSLFLTFKRTITLVDAGVLVTLFAVYTLRISRAPAEEPELVGPAAFLATFTTVRRRLAVALMLAFSAVVILMCAEPFADALVGAGSDLGISEFLLVQWLAPLASEAPELLIAGLYAWRLKADAGLGMLVSAKVNQWTLLVGTVPVVFALSSGGLHGLPIDEAQRGELLLTASQSLFAVAILANLQLSLAEAGTLFGLFWAQFIIGALMPESAHGVERVIVSVTYIALGVIVFVRDRHRVSRLMRDGIRTPYEELERVA